MVSIDVRKTLRDYIQNIDKSDSEDDATEAVDAWDQKLTFLTSCLTDLNQLRASDAKDKVYGVYALSKKLGVPLPSVDYTKSVAQVYADAASAVIIWSSSLTVLRNACTPKRIADLASWVPDWDDASARMWMPTANATNGSKHSWSSPSPSSTPKTKLLTRGYAVGRVGKLTKTFDMLTFPSNTDSISLPILSNAETSPVEDVESLRLLIDRIRFLRELYHLLKTYQGFRQSRNISDMFLDVLTCEQENTFANVWDLLLHILLSPSLECDLRAGRAVAENWKALDRGNEGQWSSELTTCTTIAASLLSSSIRVDNEIIAFHEDLLDAIKEISQNLADKTIVAIQLDADSRNRLVGSCFNKVEIKDKIVLLEGAEWPVILRLKDAEWIFISPAFVLGMMDGEAWPKDRVSHQAEEFVLV